MEYLFAPYSIPYLHINKLFGAMCLSDYHSTIGNPRTCRKRIKYNTIEETTYKTAQEAYALSVIDVHTVLTIA